MEPNREWEPGSLQHPAGHRRAITQDTTDRYSTEAMHHHASGGNGMSAPYPYGLPPPSPNLPPTPAPTDIYQEQSARMRSFPDLDDFDLQLLGHRQPSQTPRYSASFFQPFNLPSRLLRRYHRADSDYSLDVGFHSHPDYSTTPSSSTPQLCLPPRAFMLDTPQDTGSSSSPGLSSPALRAAERHSHPTHKARQTVAAPVAPPPPEAPMAHAPRHLSLAHAPPIASGIHLVDPKQSLPEAVQRIFPYALFNAVQSKCFGSVYQSNDNVVVSAPTGSGKTVILELAICRLVSERTNQNFKAVYMAPTKALCAERFRDWHKKFAHLGLSCAELTGDTSMIEAHKVGAAHIIVTTPEKWDSITRKWADHRKLLELVELFLIDEVHILKDVRGATLEAVVCRMKTIGANVRFVALSATVPNSEDVARWLGKDHTNPQLPARRETFGEDLRPVRLQKYVYGEHCGGNDFSFDTQLDKKLHTVLAKHTKNKPIMVFCFTRRSCEITAQRLAEAWSVAPLGARLWPAPRKEITVTNKPLCDIVHQGVAFHHAGLDAHDRATVERCYLSGELHVICCTSTLAVGVNLPCHTVVLKGTVGYSDGKLTEYSDLEVMQMLGRAGRPQFDDSAVAIIFTRAENKARYADMVSGQQVLESTLHLNLIEHLNSEIRLGIIADTDSAKAWLNGTFLSIRLQRNPAYYQLDALPSQISHVVDRLEQICEKHIKQLQEGNIITQDSKFSCTPYGIAMSKYMIRFATMKMILAIPGAVGIQELLTSLSKAEEFKDVRLKANERAFYRRINESPFIRYKIKGVISDTWQKVSLLVQSEIGGVEYPTEEGIQMPKSQHLIDKRLVFDRMKPLVKCVIDCKGADCDGVGVRNALDLLRSIKAGGWEGMPSQLLQVPGIGPVTMRKLVQRDILNMRALADTAPEKIQMFLSKNHPFGRNLLAAVDRFPKLSLTAKAVTLPAQRHPGAGPPSINVRATLKYNSPNGPPTAANATYLTFTAETTGGTLAYFWRGPSKKLAGDHGLDLEFSAPLSDPKDRVLCSFNCEDYVGLGCSATVEHSLPDSAFTRMAMAPATIPRPEPKKPSPPRAASPSNEFEDSFDDEDLLEAAEKMDSLESATFNSLPQALEVDSGDDEFPSVKSIIAREVASPTNVPSQVESQTESQIAAQYEPVQLPNGRWRCNHYCTGGGATKSGKPCKHLCCKEGLEKKPKEPKPRSDCSTVAKRKHKKDPTPSNNSAARQNSPTDRQSEPLSAKRRRNEAQKQCVSVGRPTRPKVPPYKPLTISDSYQADVIDLSCDTPPSSQPNDDPFTDPFDDDDIIMLGSRAGTRRKDDHACPKKSSYPHAIDSGPLGSLDCIPSTYPEPKHAPGIGASVTRQFGGGKPLSPSGCDPDGPKIIREASELLDLPPSPWQPDRESWMQSESANGPDILLDAPGLSEGLPSTLDSDLIHAKIDSPCGIDDGPVGSTKGFPDIRHNTSKSNDLTATKEEPAWVKEFEEENPTIMDLVRCSSITFI